MSHSDNHVLSHLVLRAKYNIGVHHSTVKSYHYFIENFLSVVKLPDGTLEQRKIIACPKLKKEKQVKVGIPQK